MKYIYTNDRRKEERKKGGKKERKAGMFHSILFHSRTDWNQKFQWIGIELLAFELICIWIELN